MNVIQDQSRAKLIATYDELIASNEAEHKTLVLARLALTGEVAKPKRRAWQHDPKNADRVKSWKLSLKNRKPRRKLGHKK